MLFALLLIVIFLGILGSLYGSKEGWEYPAYTPAGFLMLLLLVLILLKLLGRL